jgi:DNA-directed RNA polymerase subunit RPC12/RpoP
MSKAELRAKCREYKIAYGKMNNEMMREALAYKMADDFTVNSKLANGNDPMSEANAPAPHNEETEPVINNGADYYANENDQTDNDNDTPASNFTFENMVQTVTKCAEQKTDIEKNVSEQVCPYCGGTDHLHHTDIPPNRHLSEPVELEWYCMECGEQYGAPIKKSKQNIAAPVVKTNKCHNDGYKIEKNREECFGIKRPSMGTICREIWDLCDNQTNIGSDLTLKILREMTAQRGIHPTTTAIQYYNWRKFKGLKKIRS